MKAVLLWMIRFYRKVISPARPPLLPFHPHLLGLCFGGH